MTVGYRDGELGDAAALKQLFAESFVETFGHLYRPADLDEFMADNSDSKWHANLTDPAIAIHVAEEDGSLKGFIELAPKKLPYDTDVPALELRMRLRPERVIATGDVAGY